VWLTGACLRRRIENKRFRVLFVECVRKAGLKTRPFCCTHPAQAGAWQRPPESGESRFFTPRLRTVKLSDDFGDNRTLR
jgi:hypothetical protein